MAAAFGDIEEARRRFPAVFALAPRRRRRNAAGWLSGIFVLGICLWWAGFSPTRLGNGLARLGWLFQFLFPPSHGGWWREFLHALAETVAMAFLGTLLATLMALPTAFCAAQNIVRSRLVHVPLRRILDTIRGVDALIWALIFVSAVGLGPFAGVMAIAASDFPMLAKIFSEAIENVRPGPILGVRAVGARRLQQIRFGVMPAVLPVLAGHVLYFFESNTRSATVIGVVGAGGIGMQLMDRLRLNNWSEACFLIMLILVAVAVIDVISRWLRLCLLKPRALHAAEANFAAAAQARETKGS
jgi:phosphonate transport system permease protein